MEQTDEREPIQSNKTSQVANVRKKEEEEEEEGGGEAQRGGGGGESDMRY